MSRIKKNKAAPAGLVACLQISKMGTPVIVKITASKSDRLYSMTMAKTKEVTKPMMSVAKSACRTAVVALMQSSAR